MLAITGEHRIVDERPDTQQISTDTPDRYPPTSHDTASRYRRTLPADIDPQRQQILTNTPTDIDRQCQEISTDTPTDIANRYRPTPPAHIDTHPQQISTASTYRRTLPADIDRYRQQISTDTPDRYRPTPSTDIDTHPQQISTDTPNRYWHTPPTDIDRHPRQILTHTPNRYQPTPPTEIDTHPQQTSTCLLWEQTPCVHWGFDNPWLRIWQSLRDISTCFYCRWQMWSAALNMTLTGCTSRSVHARLSLLCAVVTICATLVNTQTHAAVGEQNPCSEKELDS